MTTKISDLTTMTTVELRKLGASLKIPKASRGRKAELLESIAAVLSVSENSTKNKGRPAKARCVDCGTRPITKESPEHQLCEPCLTKAGWENAHSDNDHETTPEDGCWVCDPTLDRSSADYVAKRGTPRAGMQMLVPGKLTGAEKARLVTALLAEHKIVAKVHASKGVTQLKAERGTVAVVIEWTTTGRDLVGIRYSLEAGEDSKKARNVSEAFRHLGLAA
jgi:hypothetical protein